MEINELKDKVLAALGQATDGAKDVAGRGLGGAKGIVGTLSDKAKSGGRIAKLSMEAASAREDVKKTYLEIGRLYYDTHKDDPEGFFVQLFEEVRLAEEGIAAKEAELAELKESFKERPQDVTVEFTEEDAFADVVDQAEAEAGGVVERFEDLKAAAEEKAAEAAEAVEEQVETVAEAVEEKAEELAAAAEELKDEAADQAEALQEAAAETAEKVAETAADIKEDIEENLGE